jgi:hypothetical protein
LILVVHLHAAQGPFLRGTNSVLGVVFLQASSRSAGLVSEDFASFPMVILSPRVKARDKAVELSESDTDSEMSNPKNADPCCQGHLISERV